jgi:hypothetical protein
MSAVLILTASLWAGKASAAVHIQFDPVGDNAPIFFSVQERMDALDAVKKTFEARLNDTLTLSKAESSLTLFIDPRTGAAPSVTLATFFPNGLPLEQDTIHVLVGVHASSTNPSSIGGYTFDDNRRGTSHVVPTVGILSFADRSGGGDWCFHRDSCPNDFNDFVAVAEHELGHVLGFSDRNADFAAHTQAIGDRQAFFRGVNSIAAYTCMGGVIDATHPGVPLDLKTPGHWAPWRNAAGTDEYQAGQSGSADPNQGAAGFFETSTHVPIRAGMQEINAARVTELDFAALRDIGWQIVNNVPQPCGCTSAGSAGPHDVVTGITGLTNKQTPPNTPGFVARETSQATLIVNGQLHTYFGMTNHGHGSDEIFIYVDRPADPNDPTRFDTGEQSPADPSLTVLDGKLYMAWVGTDEHVNVVQLAVDPVTGTLTGETPQTKQTLGYTTDGGVGLTAFGGALFMAFGGEDNHLYLDVKDIRGSKKDWGPNAFDTGEQIPDDTIPILTAFPTNSPPSDQHLILDWFGTDGSENIATVQYSTSNVIVPQGGCVNSKSLTLDGDQLSSGPDDTISFGRNASNGNFQITLNGQLFEYAAGALTNATINTGAGGNIVNVLATFPDFALTINGGGTDRLSFGPNPPANTTYTPDANGLSGYGTLNAGGMLIHFTGLEFVDAVAPHLTGVQLDHTTIDENGVVTLSGTFTDPGAFSTHSRAIDWGDGTSDAAARLGLGARSFAVSHRYLDDNPAGTPSDRDTITVTITDNDNLTGTGTTPITVNNVAVVITSVTGSSPSSTPATEGASVTLSGTFTDVGTRDTHTASVDWGDGTSTAAQITESGGAGTFQAQHAFPAGGIYTVAVTVTDDDTGQASATVTMFVTGVGVQQINGQRALVAVGTAGDDSLTINQASGQFVVHASFLAADRTIPVTGIQLIEVVLLAGDDRATIAGNVTLPSVVDGGPGNDRLFGGGGPNILIGGPGDDTLIGGGARDILIGGFGSDRLAGNGGDDILIAGSTLYDSGPDSSKLANDAILMRLQDEWNSSRSYDQRIANIRAGSGPILGGSGISLSKGTTVFDDSSFDQLTGSAGSDWFFFDPTRDQATDKASTEVVNSASDL